MCALTTFFEPHGANRMVLKIETKLVLCAVQRSAPISHDDVSASLKDRYQDHAVYLQNSGCQNSGAQNSGFKTAVCKTAVNAKQQSMHKSGFQNSGVQNSGQYIMDGIVVLWSSGC